MAGAWLRQPLRRAPLQQRLLACAAASSTRPNRGQRLPRRAYPRQRPLSPPFLALPAPPLHRASQPAPPALTELRAAPRAPGPRGNPSVPEFMKLKPDAAAAAALAAKAKLTDALKPSADMMDAIMANPALMQAR